MVFGKVSVNSFLDSLQTDDLWAFSDVGQLVSESLVWVFMFMLGDWQKFQEQVVDHSEWSNQDTDTPLLRSKAVVGVDTEGSSSESDQNELEHNNDNHNGKENRIFTDSFKDI